MPYAALAALQHHETCRTRFYLRSAVEAIARAVRGPVPSRDDDDDDEQEEEGDEEGVEEGQGGAHPPPTHGGADEASPAGERVDP